MRRPLLDDSALYSQLFKVYSWYKRGYLPDQGTYLDQAAAYVRLLDIMEQAVADANALKEKIEKSRSAAKRPTVG